MASAIETFVKLIFLIIITLVCESKGGARFKRIVNGDDALPGAFPHQVCLRKKSGTKYVQFCGGSIIDEQFILTAAHCVLNNDRNAFRKKEDIQVVFGTTNLDSIKNEDSPFTRKVLEMYANKNFDKPNQYVNDIALIKIEPIVLDNINVAAIDLPNFNEPVPNGTKVWISGWGRIYGPDSPLSSTLKATQVTVINHFSCVQTYRNYRRTVHLNQFCAHETDKDDTLRKGVCNNDSGGPVTLLTSEKRVLVGIISWAMKDPDCASPKFPDVYTQVSDFIHWIYKHMDRLKKPTKEKYKST